MIVCLEVHCESRFCYSCMIHQRNAKFNKIYMSADTRETKTRKLSKSLFKISFLLGFLLELSRDIVLIGGGVLVLLVLRNKIVKIGLSLSEFHLVHTLTSVPVEVSLSAEHKSKLISDTLPCLLDGGRVTNENTGHLESWRWDVTDGCLKVIRDPLNKVRRVLVHHAQHLVINFLRGHVSTEHHSTGEVTSMTGVGGAHHILGVEGLSS
mmetsp:Transcript_6783/g.6461  ORF Transcript_6783/g.6461 Transcript_6783/m.6461 type:complete len:209 (-) Transcript_6783:330-956(-)